MDEFTIERGPGYWSLKKTPKDARLPRGWGSWTAFAEGVPSQDDLIKLPNTERIVLHHVMPDNPHPNPTNEPRVETFECDVLTLKVRAFDEIAPILKKVGGYRNWIQIHHDLQRLFSTRLTQHGERPIVLDIIEDLKNLYE